MINDRTNMLDHSVSALFYASIIICTIHQIILKSFTINLFTLLKSNPLISPMAMPMPPKV